MSIKQGNRLQSLLGWTPRTAEDGGSPESSYAAFISYRHISPDREWAEWLQAALETYRLPGGLAREGGLPRRIARVFRDEEELAASPDLSDSIKAALARSRFLIVVCSPQTLDSQWVAEEIRTFRDLGRGDCILVLLVAGEPGELFPRLFAQGPEPLAADVRVARPPRRRLPFVPIALRRARIKLLAPILGRGFDELWQRDWERQRRKLVLGGAAAGVLVTVLSGLALFALDSSRERARQEAMRLAAASQQVADAGDPAMALLLAAEAVRASPRGDADHGFHLRRLQQLGLAAPLRLQMPPPVEFAAFTPDLARMGTSGGGSARIVDLRNGRLVGTYSPPEGALSGEPALSGDGRTLALGIDYGEAVAWTPEVGGFKRHPNPQVVMCGTPGSALYFSPDFRTLAWWVGVETGDDDGQHVQASWRLDTGKAASTAALDTVFRYGRLSWSRSPERNDGVVVTPAQRIRVVDVSTGEPQSPEFGPDLGPHGVIHSLAMTTDARWVVAVTSGTGAGEVRLSRWDARSGEPAGAQDVNEAFEILDVSADGMRVVAATGEGQAEGSIILWDLNHVAYRAGHHVLAAIRSEEGFLHFSDGRKIAAFVLDDTAVLAVSGPRNRIASGTMDHRVDPSRPHVRLWDVGGSLPDLLPVPELTMPLQLPREVAGWDASRDGRAFAVVGRDGTVVVHDLSWSDPDPNPVPTPLRLGAPYDGAWFDPSGRHVLTARRGFGVGTGGMPDGPSNAPAGLEAWQVSDGARLWPESVPLAWDYGKRAVVRFSPDGRSVALIRKADGGSGEEAAVLDLATGAATAVGGEEEPGSIVDLAFGRDGRTLVAAVETSEYGLIARTFFRKWDLGTGEEAIVEWRAHDPEVSDSEELRFVGFGRDSDLFVVAEGKSYWPIDWSEVRSLQLWRLEPVGPASPLLMSGSAEALPPALLRKALEAGTNPATPDPRTFTLDLPNGTLALRPTEAGAIAGAPPERAPLEAPPVIMARDPTSVDGPVLSPDGTMLATLGATAREIRVWWARSGAPVTETLLLDAPAVALVFDRNGDRLVVLTRTGRLVSHPLGIASTAQEGWLDLLPAALTEMELASGRLVRLDVAEVARRRSIFVKALRRSVAGGDLGVVRLLVRWRDLVP